MYVNEYEQGRELNMENQKLLSAYYLSPDQVVCKYNNEWDPHIVEEKEGKISQKTKKKPC